MALISTLVDNFNDDSFDAALWTRTSAVNILEQNQRIEFVKAASNRALVSTNTYDLTGSSIYWQVPNVYVELTPVRAGVKIETGTTQTNAIFFDISVSSKFRLNKTVANTNTFGTTLGDYNSSNNWFRIRESSGTVYGDYSTDGVNWTNLDSFATPITITAIYFYAFSGTFFGTDQQSQIIDNVNDNSSITSTSTSASTTSRSISTSSTSLSTSSTSSSISTSSTSSSTSLSTSSTSSSLSTSSTSSSISVSTSSTSTSLSTSISTSSTSLSTSTSLSISTSSTSTSVSYTTSTSSTSSSISTSSTSTSTSTSTSISTSSTSTSRSTSTSSTSTSISDTTSTSSTSSSTSSTSSSTSTTVISIDIPIGGILKQTIPRITWQTVKPKTAVTHHR